MGCLLPAGGSISSSNSSSVRPRSRYLSICVGKYAGVQACWNAKRPHQLEAKIYWVVFMYTM
eukprot:11455195-Prorocentrum_lima.AAC.1